MRGSKVLWTHARDASRWHGRPRHEGWPSGGPVAGGEAHAPATKVMISSSDPGHFGGGGTHGPWEGRATSFSLNWDVNSMHCSAFVLLTASGPSCQYSFGAPGGAFHSMGVPGRRPPSSFQRILVMHVVSLTASGPSCQYSWYLAYRRLTQFFSCGCRREVAPISGPFRAHLNP